MKRIHTGASRWTPRGKEFHWTRAPQLALALMALLALTLSACTLGGGTTTPTPTATITTTPAVTATPTSGETAIKVYFSKATDSLNNFTAVFPVERMSPSKDLKTFALQLLIAGPTPEERSQGYFSELNSIMSGSSTCASQYHTGPDLVVTANMKGSTAESGTYTVKLCRETHSPGIGADARITAEINATLKQFPEVKKVVILTQSGDCFGDMSTQNRCLQ